MASLAVTNTFVSLATITAAGHNTNFSDIVTYVNNRNSGSANWDACNVLSSTGVPFSVDNSSGANSIAVFKDNGSAVLTILDGGNVQGTGVYLGPAGAVGAPAYSFSADPNTGIYNTGDDRIYISTGGTEALRITSGQTVYFASNGSAAGPTISFLTDSDTGIYNQAANSMSFVSGGVQTVQVSTATFNPVGAGVVSSGDGSSYWNDISYKTLTDRGCLPWADDGVELRDGTIVSDCEALAQVKKHPTKITIQGLPMLDYKSFPKVSYRVATSCGETLPRDENDEPIGGQDGIEMTSMFGFMIGAIKELHNRVLALEPKNV